MMFCPKFAVTYSINLDGHSPYKRDSSAATIVILLSDRKWDQAFDISTCLSNGVGASTLEIKVVAIEAAVVGVSPCPASASVLWLTHCNIFLHFAFFFRSALYIFLQPETVMSLPRKLS
uniref:Uncharacterized protein n=1 Tax=Erpetoichthys calabaricus TaxID=27687 RepID=A0A8C4TB05_ERPCA